MSLHDQLQELFRQVFNDDELLLTDRTTPNEISGWDSVAHLNLMFSIEEHFGVTFVGNELAEFRDIGELKEFLIRNRR